MKKLITLFIFNCIAWPYMAYAEDQPTGQHFFPLPPRATVSAFAGNRILGEADMLLPLYGKQDDVFYMDAQGKSIFAPGWLASVGLGAREVVNDHHILGAYLFLDRNVSDMHQLFWFANPGVEYLSQTWDFHGNAYLPTGAKQKYITTDFADNLGNYNDIHFQGHTQWDAILNEYETVGWGADAEVGHSIPKVAGLRVYAGGYHSNPQNMSAINGISSRAEYAINSHWSINLRESYDNWQHNSVLLGINFTLGGVNRYPRDVEQPIQNRLLDPVVRHLATQAQANGEPISTQQQVMADSVVERDNIWFFQQDGDNPFQDGSSCTAENPCSGFDQRTIDGINQIAPPNPNFYFKPGQYTSIQTSAISNASPLDLNDDALFGRSDDYKQPEQSAVFNGALNLAGVDKLDSLILHNVWNDSQNAALNLASDSAVTLDHTKIGEDNNLQGYVTGIAMNNATLHLNDSQIYAYSNSIKPAIGINASGETSNIMLNNSQINANASGRYQDVGAIGILAQGDVENHVVLANSEIDATVNGLNNWNAHDVSVTGISVKGANNTVQLLGNSAVNVMAMGSNITHANSVGIAANASDGGENSIELKDNSIINASAQLGLGNYWSNNVLSVSGISAVTGMNAQNYIAMNGHSKINASIIDGDSGGIGDLLTVDGIFASGGSGSMNAITLKDHSMIKALMDYEGTRSFSSHNTAGIFAIADHNQIDMADESRIDVNAYISEASSGHNEISEYGILSSGPVNDVHLAGNAQINALTDVEGGRGNVIYLNGIGVLQGINTVTLANNSSVKAQAVINDTNAENFDFVSGLSANGVNTINVLDNSLIEATGSVKDQYGFNTVKVRGIDLTGTSQVYLSEGSLIQAIAAAAGNQPQAQAYGIDSQFSKSEITDADSSLSNINASATAPDGEAIAKKINPYMWGE